LYEDLNEPYSDISGCSSTNGLICQTVKVAWSKALGLIVTLQLSEILVLTIFEKRKNNNKKNYSTKAPSS